MLQTESILSCDGWYFSSSSQDATCWRMREDIKDYPKLAWQFPETDLTSVYFINPSIGWACGSWNTILKFDANAEDKWISMRIENEPAGFVWNDIFFLNEDTGWIVGPVGTVYKTDDGGNTWLKESTGLFSDLNAIHMVNSSTGWIVGEEGVILTYTPGN